MPSTSAVDELAPSTPSPEEVLNNALQAKIQEAAAKDRAEQCERGFDNQNFPEGLQTLSEENFSKIVDDIEKNSNISLKLAAEIIGLLKDKHKAGVKIDEKIAPELAQVFVDHLEILLKRLPATLGKDFLQELAAKAADLSYYQKHPLPRVNHQGDIDDAKKVQGILAGVSLFGILGLVVASSSSMENAHKKTYKLAGSAIAGIVQAGNSMMDGVSRVMQLSLQNTNKGDELYDLADNSV